MDIRRRGAYSKAQDRRSLPWSIAYLAYCQPRALWAIMGMLHSDPPLPRRALVAQDATANE